MMPKAPKVKELPTPSRTSAEVQQAAEQQRAAIAAETSATNWLTGGLGVNEKRVKTGASALLGG